MQDLIAIAVAAAAAIWLAWSLTKRFFAPPCQPPDVPGGGDGFVPLDTLRQTAPPRPDPARDRSRRRSP